MAAGAAMQEPDPHIVAAAAARDMRAFEDIVRAYQADAWRFAVHILGSDGPADDVVQDAFIRVYRFLPRYRGDSKFSTWLFTIVRNCAMDELRRSGRHRRAEERVEAEPLVHHEDQSTRIEVREAIAELPLTKREAIVLIDVFGLSYAEAAVLMRVPVGTVKSRVHQAREQLARSLRPHPEEDADAR